MTGVSPAPAADRALGAVLAALTLAVVGAEWTGWPPLDAVASALAAAAIALTAPAVRATGKVFVAVGLVLVAWALLAQPGWPVVVAALRKSAFIAAFFTALTTLRHAADASAAIADCGRYLAQQPPGRRYLALTTGGHLFALLLSYGAIALLGSLAVANARQEPDPEIREHRRRRMLLAIQRGFVSSLAWSPLAFSMAISLALIPEASWIGVVGPCLVTAAILTLVGWALDTIFKPRLNRPRPVVPPPQGGWRRMRPLLVLLAVLVVSVGGLQLVTGLRAVSVVLLVVPLLSVVWVALQGWPAPLVEIGRRGGRYFARDLPGYRTELVFLMLAGLIGTLGGALLVPILAASGIDTGAAPGWAVLMALLWGIPLLGQVGANPILAVTLFAPLLPPPASVGLDANDLIVAITAGWAMAGATSPYTATTLLVGSFGGVSARHVGLVWNLGFVLTAGVLLSGWVLLAAVL